ncbi:MAG: hypothetical protein HEQ39_09555 [Rhizobacter sp.]
MKTAPTLNLSNDVPLWVCELARDAYQIGWALSERENYKSGWWWGLVCGTLLGSLLITVAFCAGRGWAP